MGRIYILEPSQIGNGADPNGERKGGGARRQPAQQIAAT